MLPNVTVERSYSGRECGKCRVAVRGVVWADVDCEV